MTFFQIRLKTLEENVANLDNNVWLRKDLEQSVKELWKILRKKWKPKKGQQVAPPWSHATVLQQKKSGKDRNQVEENKNNDSKNKVEQSFTLIIFGVVSLNW